MSLLKDLKNLFDTENLYEVLGVSRDADATQIRKAYYRKSLQTHPDRSSDDDRDTATSRFQALGKVYALLSDSDRRAAYDDSGDVDDDAEQFLARERDWTAYWHRVYKSLTREDIEAYRKTYQGSEEESADLKEAYERHEGDMDRIIDSIMCANALDDEDRFRSVIDEWIRNGKVKEYPLYGNEDKDKQMRRRERAEKEAAEAEEAAKELGIKGSLEEAIGEKMKQREGEGFVEKLEEKYGGEGEVVKKRGRGRPRKVRAPDEETKKAPAASGVGRGRLRKKIREEAAEEAEWSAEKSGESRSKRPRKAAKKGKYEELAEDDEDDLSEEIDEEADIEEEEEEDDEEEFQPKKRNTPSPAKEKAKKTPTGRKRGRPRKNPPKEAVEGSSEADGGNKPAEATKEGEVVKKRGRGRPPKKK